MSATVSLARPTVLVIHDDGDALDIMTRLFEASGFDVVTAVTGFRAQAHLEGDRPVDVVVAPWDAAHPVGGEVYRWSLQRRYDLRDQFVFVASEVAPDFDQIVAGRCLAMSMARPAEIVRVALAVVKRKNQLEESPDTLAELAEVEQAKPRLLLADDEPVLLMVIGDFLAQSGYAVTRVESGHAAIILLHHEEFDAIVTDWQMDDGTGADIYRWIVQKKPQLAQRIVFLSDGEGDDPSTIAPGRPMFRKGQDSHGLTSVLEEIVRETRSQPIPA
jgi:CheY-like chemotaxis protein